MVIARAVSVVLLEVVVSEGLDFFAVFWVWSCVVWFIFRFVFLDPVGPGFIFWLRPYVVYPW